MPLPGVHAASGISTESRVATGVAAADGGRHALDADADVGGEHDGGNQDEDADGDGYAVAEAGAGRCLAGVEGGAEIRHGHGSN